MMTTIFHSKPPRREHEIFRRVGKFAKVPPRRRPAFRPDLIDAGRFLVDPIRPFPEWPFICRTTNRLAFANTADIAVYLTKIAMSSNLDRIWQCADCELWHYECSPSGKSTRKDNYKHNHNK